MANHNYAKLNSDEMSNKIQAGGAADEEDVMHDAPSLAKEGRPYSSSLHVGSTLLKTFLGSGVLALPYAFKEGGLVLTPILMIVMCSLAAYMCYALLDVKNDMLDKGKNVVTYADIANEALGVWGGRLVNVALVFTQLGFCCVYVVYVAKHTAAISGWNFLDIAWCLFPIYVLMGWVRSLKWVAPMSIVACIAVCGAMAVVLVAAFPRAAAWSRGDLPESRVDLFVPATLPITFGMITYSFEGIGLVIPCESSMRYPKRFPRVLTITMIISVSVYLLFGIVGYLAFGDDTNSQGVTLNLELAAEYQTPVWRTLQLTIQIMLIVSILFTYPGQLYVAIEILEDILFDKLQQRGYEPKPKQVTWIQNGFRLALVLLTYLVALSIPDFSLLIGLVGSLGSASLEFIIPSLLNLVHFGYRFDGTRPTHEIIADGLCFVLGLLGAVLGSVESIRAIVLTLSGQAA